MQQKVQHAILETQKNLYERGSLAKLIWLTIGADLNLLMLGDPGTAKTMIAVNLVNTIKSARKFQYTLNTYTTIDELFGHFDFMELKNNNRLKRNIANKLLDSHIAYLDEFFKSNSGTLNALLDIMNEKIYIDAYGKVKLPLKFLISSSNELPNKEDGLSAVLDRFQVKVIVKAIQDHSTRISAYQEISKCREPINQVMSLTDIDNYRIQVNKVEYTREVAEMTESIYQQMLKENIIVSDRTVFKTIPLVKAAAFLRGAKTVEAPDLLVLKDVFWTELSEIKKVKKIIYDLANPIMGKVEEVWEAISATMEEKAEEVIKLGETAPSELSIINFETLKKVRSASKELDELKKSMVEKNMDTSEIDSRMKKLDVEIGLLLGDT